ncbi:MAG TPA: DAK2 domain-containing protein, partial [Solirubrobacteraceae bacterium]|nr:DAK2 domain-containing protein [Solirubrobacteraceae bacterium]
IRGAAEELVSRPGQLIDASLIGAALAKAADRAYASVREPAEGTILTVAREMAHSIVADVAHDRDAGRFGPATEPGEQDRAIADTLERAVVVGQDSVKRGPELLAALREAGVVDAGGYGLTVIFAGVVAALRGDAAPELEHHAPAQITHPEHSSSTYRYCTNFAVTGSDLRAGAFTDALERLGDSVLVVGDAKTLKVHVHTDEPERATGVFAEVGEVSHLDVADMRAQVSERERRLAGAVTNGNGTPSAVRCAALAVVNGDGLAQMYRDLGVYTVDGGPTMNPSTAELLAGIHEAPAEEVVVLPCSPNVVMAAEYAAERSDKRVRVVAVTSQQAGLIAAVALSGERDVAENALAMQEAVQALRVGAVAPAARADAQGRFQPGEAVGLLGEEVIAWGEPRSTLQAVLAALAPDAELISVISGAQAPLELSELDGIMDGDVELELRHGGQPAYWWLLAAE